MKSKPLPLTVDEANERLRSAGLRRTFTRISILQCLAKQTAPVTHAEIAAELLQLGFDASTIFRGLGDLVSAAIVSRLDLGDHTWRFELRTKVVNSHAPYLEHPHIVCTGCGRIICLTEDSLGLQRSQQHELADWQIEEVLLKGRCPQCHTPPP